MRIVRSVSLVLLTSCLVVLSFSITYGVEEEQDFSLLDFKSGKKVSFEDILIAKANVLVVTETTCGSCIKEIQALEQLRARLRGDMAVIINFVDPGGWSRVKKYLDYYQFDMDMFLEDSSGRIPEMFGVKLVPTMIVFDRKGIERFRKQGFQVGDEKMIDSRIMDVISPPRRVVAEKPAVDFGDHVGGAPVGKTKGCATTG